MFEGYLRNGGVEVINVERTMRYVKAGMVPVGVTVESPMFCDGLGEAVGDSPYRTPALDAAPWFDSANPDSGDFAGILPLSFTGLDDTTRSVTVTDRTTDGGTPSAPRRGPRTIAASALLVGRDAAAAAVGLQWLSTVLHRACEPDADCEGTTLDGFLVCPSPGDLEDISAALVPTVITRDSTWLTYGGTWDSATNIYSVPEQANDILDGGTPGAEPVGIVDGGGPTGDPGSNVVTGGDPESASTPRLITAHLALPELLGCVSRVEVVWQLKATTSDPDGSVLVQFGAVDVLGGALEVGPPIAVSSAGVTLTWSRDFVPWEEWRPALWSDTPGVQITAHPVLRLRPLVSIEDCVRPYRRSFAQVVCVDGPKVVNAYQGSDECGGSSLLQVEWTWVAGDPYRYGEATNLVTGLPVTSNGAPIAEAVHVGHTFLGTISAAATSCPAPQEPVTCATDPSYPGFIAPPSAPVIVDPGAVSPTNYTRQQITIENQLVPDTGASALRFTFVNDATVKRGVRARIYHFPEGGGVPDECDFEDEFWINYIPASAVFIVDGVAGQVIVDCPDNTSASARRVMRGPYKGAFAFPTLRCGGSYTIMLDTPSGTGALTVTLDSAPREG